MKYPLICIDPGKNGGIAVSDATGKTAAYPMPDTVHDLKDLLNRLLILNSCDPLTRCEVIIERVHSMPTDAASAAFAFGENFGMIQGVLAAIGASYRFVQPHAWQKKVGALPKNKPERKRALKAFAQQRYPHLAVTLKTADALAMLAVETEKATHGA